MKNHIYHNHTNDFLCVLLNKYIFLYIIRHLEDLSIFVRKSIVTAAAGFGPNYLEKLMSHTLL